MIVGTTSAAAAQAGPRANDAASRLGQTWLVDAIVLLAVSFVSRLIGWIPTVIDPDEGIFSLAAREVVAGHLPYVTLFDNKPVGSTLILAAAFAALGQSILVTRIVGMIAAWTSGLLVALLLQSSGFRRQERLTAGVVQIVYISALGLGGQATLTEILLVPFTLAGALLVKRAAEAGDLSSQLRIAIGAGLACGVAVLIKIVPLLPGLAIATTTVLLAFARARITLVGAIRILAFFTLAAVTPMLIAVGVYAAAGALDQFVWSNFGFAGAYIATHPKPVIVVQRLLAAIEVLWPLLAMAFVAILGSGLAWRRREMPEDLLIICVIWLAAELVSASASLQFFPHYFLTSVPPLVVLTAFGFRAIASWVGASVPSRVAVVIGAVIALVAFEQTQSLMLGERLDRPDMPRRLAGVIKNASHGRKPTVFVTSYKLSSVYLLTDSPLPPTRYSVPAHLFSRQSKMTGSDPRPEVFRALAARPDFVVVNTSERKPDWAEALLGRTLRKYRIIFADGPVHVFALNSAGGGSPP